MLISPFTTLGRVVIVVVLVPVVVVLVVEARNTFSLYSTLTRSLSAEKASIDTSFIAGSTDKSMGSEMPLLGMPFTSTRDAVPKRTVLTAILLTSNGRAREYVGIGAFPGSAKFSMSSSLKPKSKRKGGSRLAVTLTSLPSASSKKSMSNEAKAGGRITKTEKCTGCGPEPFTSKMLSTVSKKPAGRLPTKYRSTKAPRPLMG